MMDQKSAQPLPEESIPGPEKPPIFPLAALVLPFIGVLCCSLVFLPYFFAEDRLFIYWRNFAAIGLAEAVFCFGGVASLAAIVLGGFALAKGQKYKAASIIGIILGILVGISACLIMPVFLLIAISSI